MNAKKNDWIGVQKYARVPESVLLDSRLGPRHFKLLSILALHADKDGIAWPGLERLAEMLGYFKKDGEPDKQIISKLISWKHEEKSPGLGLVELGYIKKLGWIANRETQSYQLLIPNVSETAINNPKSRKLSDVDFSEKQRIKMQGMSKAETKKEEKKSAAHTFVYGGEKYTKNEVHNAFLAGELEMYPMPVIEYFGYREG